MCVFVCAIIMAIKGSRNDFKASNKYVFILLITADVVHTSFANIHTDILQSQCPYNFYFMHHHKKIADPKWKQRALFVFVSFHETNQQHNGAARSRLRKANEKQLDAFCIQNAANNAFHLLLILITHIFLRMKSGNF